jgi:hypothetical protein
MSSVSRPLVAFWLRLADYMTSAPADLFRHTIAFDIAAARFTVSRPDRAYALMDIDKALSFSEWFGLRPMSELEFEKSSRGPLPPSADVTNRPDKAWGPETDYPIAEQYPNFVPFTLSAPENGTEYFTDYNVSKRHVDPIGKLLYGSPTTPGATGGDGGFGPYRVGIFATDNSSRILAGASYYGIMDLSKIAAEIVFPLSTAANRLLSYNINGQGILSASGGNYNFTNVLTNLPGSTTNNFYRKGTISLRGNSDNYFKSFRAVRSAPSDN